MMSPNNYYELSKYRDSPVSFQGKYSPRMQYLIDCKYIEPSKSKCIEDSVDDIQIVPIEWSITPKGEDALEEFEQARRKEAEQKSGKKFDRIFQVFLIMLGAIFGIVFDNIFGIADFVKSIIFH